VGRSIFVLYWRIQKKFFFSFDQTFLFFLEKKSLDDCRLFGLNQVGLVHLVGAYSGDFPLVMVRAAIPALQVARNLIAVAIPSAQMRPGTDGLAGFRFLNSFHYGNFGNPEQFGMEPLLA
jgi:hypothetical protein